MPRSVLIPAAVIAALLVPILLVPFILDNPEVYRDRLADTFQEETGFELEMAGEVKWRFFPPIAIEINQINITPPGASLPLASLNSARVDLRLLPLLLGGGKLRIDGISIDGLTVNALVDESGTGNWESSPDIPPEERRSTESTTERTEEKTGRSGAPPDLDITVFELTNTKISYQDLSSGRHDEITIKSLSTGALTADQPTVLRTTLQYKDLKQALVLENEIEGSIAFNQTLDQFRLEEMTLNSQLGRQDSPDLSISSQINAVIDTENGKIDFADSRIGIASLNILFSLNADNIFDKAGMRGEITVPEFNLAHFMVDAGLESPAENPNALTRVSISSNIKGTMDQIILTGINAKISDSTIEGNATINLEPRTGMAFSLTMDNLNTSDYLAPTPELSETEKSERVDTESPVADSSQSSGERADSEVIPVQQLSELTLDGKFRLNQFNHDGHVFTDLVVDVKNGGRRFDLNIGTKAYDGSLKLGISLDNIKPDSEPGGKSKINIEGIDLSKLAAIESVTGTLVSNSNLSFKGNMLSEVLGSIEGESNFSVADGTLDIRSLKQVSTMIDTLRGKTSSVSEWPDQLPFKKMAGDHRFINGEKDQQLQFTMENMKVTGKGGLDYFKNTIDYDLEAVLSNDEESQFTVSPQLADVRWPLHCEGEMDQSLKDLCLPDSKAVARLVEDLAKQELKRKGSEKVIEKVPEKYRDKARKLLKGLFD